MTQHQELPAYAELLAFERRQLPHPGQQPAGGTLPQENAAVAPNERRILNDES